MTSPDKTNGTFAMDRIAAEKLCHAAIEVQVDADKTEQLLLRALSLQPSCMLAYHLLAELYGRQDYPHKVTLCRRGILPVEATEKLFAKKVCEIDCSEPASSDRLPLFEAVQQELPPPCRITAADDEAPLPELFKEAAIVSRPCFVDQIPNGRFWHDAQHTIVLNAEGSEVAEHTLADRELICGLISQYKPVHFEGRLFLIGARGAHNFYHWMTDIAPKLGVLLQAGYVFEKTDRFVVAYANSDFCFQLLAQFGVTSEQIYESEKQYTLVSADIIVVPFVENKMALTMGPWLPALMREQFLSPKDNCSISKRLLITRAAGSSDGRQISNQQELQQCLTGRGFECIQLEDYSVAQQAQLFSQASVVVAAHGAALSNLMFCRKGAVVVELYADHIAPCFWAISALCQLNYHQLHCGESVGFAHGTSTGRSGNLTVSMKKLDELFSLAGI